jgi:cytochrome c oxidase cbb3-type subunit 3
MSTFWSRWVVILIVINLGVALWLFVWGQLMKIPTEPDGTTGHVWAHGVLRESVRRLPLWWLLMSVVAFIAAAVYFARYPGLGNFTGSLNWTSKGEFQQDVATNNAKLEAQTQSFRTLSVEQLAADPKAATIGHRLYLDNCAACHGTEATGNQLVGAPNLTDADSLYGENGETLLTSIRDGRKGVMPPLGGVLGRDGISEAASYVLSLSGVNAPKDWIAAGKTRFETLCSACHGVDGRGNAALGAPNLTDNVWLYGGDFETISASIRDGRSGDMPAWRSRLSEDEVRMIGAWVYAQGQRAAAAKL